MNHGPAPDAATAAKPVLLDAVNLIAGYFAEVDILRGCSVATHEGEIVGIIGPNGAGKSTFLKAVFGLIPVRSGTVWFRGEDITGRKAHRLVDIGIGYVPQTRNVFPSLTVEENLEMGSFLRPRRVAERLEAVSVIFPLVALRRRQRAGLLSGGERQMVAMARALMMDPDVLLVDEPSAGLAPTMQDDVFRNILEINRTGVTVIMVEQNARRCLQICDRGYVLDQGVNAHTGPGTALLHDPKVVDLYLGTLAQVE